MTQEPKQFTQLNPHLSQDEKNELLSLSREGRPLYKILKSSLDWVDEMGQYILALDIESEAGLALARQLQSQRRSVLNYAKWFVQQYADQSLEPELKEQING